MPGRAADRQGGADLLLMCPLAALPSLPLLLRLLRLLRCRATKGKPTSVDAVTLGDAWLQRAIAEGLIQPIPGARQYRWWVSPAACNAAACASGLAWGCVSHTSAHLLSLAAC